MICTAGQGPHVSETNRYAGWRAIGSKSSMGSWFIYMDAQEFFRRRLARSSGHPQIRTRSSPESAFRAAASGPNYLVHPVHPCSIYSPSRSYSCLFVFIRGSSSFPKRKRPAVPRLYGPPVVGGRGPGLPETTRCAGWLESGSKSSTGQHPDHRPLRHAESLQ